MTMYVVRRLLGIVPVLLLVALGSFLLVHLVPGDPAMVMLGNDATPQQIQALKTQMGLDRSLPEQFALWGGRFCAGTGESFFLGRPVTQSLMERLPATLQLALLSLVFSLLIGIPAGILAGGPAEHQVGPTDHDHRHGRNLHPQLLAGFVPDPVFSVQLGWLPSGGYTPSGRTSGAGSVSSCCRRSRWVSCRPP